MFSPLNRTILNKDKLMKYYNYYSYLLNEIVAKTYNKYPCFTISLYITVKVDIRKKSRKCLVHIKITR